MKPLIIGNWKCNPPTLKEAKTLFRLIAKGVRNIKGSEIIVCPPFPYLSIFLAKEKIKLGAQDVFWKNKGAFTGEVSPLMLKSLGCQYVILGHSEKRRMGDTDKIVNMKIRAAISAGLRPILCIGETAEQKNKGKTFGVLKKELRVCLSNLSDKDMSKLYVAYEPIWAIGTGNFCSFSEAEKTFLFLTKLLNKKIPILYGGSVNSENALGYIRDVKFQGLLIGGASLKPKEFVKIVREVSKP